MKFWVLFTVLLISMAGSFALKNELCGLPHSLNGDGRISCDAYIASWSYDAVARECVKFIFGGCGGNENRFGTKEICEEKCLE
ncbi:male accessory gland serine protease inhibitor-like [Drosophila hydei]|uniref:Male accessory gland serine protease inhibitor-like n=1 Tax=Drosophila hydei TaxID=7224 RepID=A0A6J1LYM3_DROHY|nr:male accessory gland serine protease inhibitor-like [Drosophila hydei]